jgi:hypothetical protein
MKIYIGMRYSDGRIVTQANHNEYILESIGYEIVHVDDVPVPKGLMDKVHEHALERDPDAQIDRLEQMLKEAREKRASA